MSAERDDRVAAERGADDADDLRLVRAAMQSLSAADHGSEHDVEHGTEVSRVWSGALAPGRAAEAGVAAGGLGGEALWRRFQQERRERQRRLLSRRLAAIQIAVVLAILGVAAFLLAPSLPALTAAPTEVSPRLVLVISLAAVCALAAGAGWRRWVEA